MILYLNARTAESERELGNAAAARGDYRAASVHWRRTLEISDQLLGKDHIEQVNYLTGLALAAAKQKEYGTAEDYYQRILAIQQKALGPERLEVAETLARLGDIRCHQGDRAGGEALYQRALEISEREPIASRGDLLDLVAKIASLREQANDLEQAERYRRRYLEICKKSAEDNKAGVAAAANELGRILLKRGNLTAASTAVQQALDGWVDALGKDHPNVAVALVNLGLVKCQQRRQEEAASCFVQALELRKKTFGADHPSTRRVRTLLESARSQVAASTVAGPARPRAIGVFSGGDKVARRKSFLSVVSPRILFLGIWGILVYVIWAVFLLSAIVAGLEQWLGWHFLIRVAIASVIAFIPIVGGIAAIIGAHDAWGWSWLAAVGAVLGGGIALEVLSTWLTSRLDSEEVKK